MKCILFIFFVCLQTRKGNNSQFDAETLPLPHLVLRMTIDLSPTDLLILYESRWEYVLVQWHQTLSNLVVFVFKEMHGILAAFLSYLSVNAEETFSGSSYPYSPRCQTAVSEWQAAVLGREDVEEITPALGFLFCYS